MKTENQHTHYFEKAGLNLNCKKATYLVSLSHERKLSSKEKIGLFFHFLICKSCRLFRKQSELLDKILKRASIPADKISFELTSEEKKGMQKKIDEGL